MTANTILLVASNAALILTGMGFWALAKRLMPVADYNQGIVLVNAIMLIGSVAGLNGHVSLPATIARRGHRSTDIVIRSLALTASLAAFGGLAYHLASLAVSEWPVVWSGWIIMPLSCAAWLIFTLQDGTLTGVGRADLVPVENLLYGLSRLAALYVATRFVDGWSAMTIAWVGPLVIAIPAVLGYVFGVALPRTPGDSVDGAVGLDRAVIRADAAGSVFSQALFRLLPLAAIVVLADENKVAALSTAWLIFATSDIMIGTVGTSLSITNPDDRDRSTRHAIILAGLAASGLAVGFILFAPLIMRILIEDVGALAVNLLRLIGVALIFRAPVHIVAARARLTHQAGRLFLIQMTSGLILIIGLGIGLSTGSLVSVGVALVVSTLIALPVIWMLRPVE